MYKGFHWGNNLKKLVDNFAAGSASVRLPNACMNSLLKKTSVSPLIAKMKRDPLSIFYNATQDMWLNGKKVIYSG